MLVLTDVVKRFPRAPVPAVDRVSFTVGPAEAYGLVGESGSGKTTLARMILALATPTAGRLLYDGAEIPRLPRRALRAYRRRVQAVFQDPFDSLSPRLRAGRIIAEPLVVHGLARGAALRDRVAKLLEAVGLPADAATRFPHQFSGGQRQRIAIARALALGPEFIVLDEPVSALDVSIQSQILNLVRDLRTSRSVGYLLISHNLAVVAYVCDRVGILYAGHLVEEGPRDLVFRGPRHPYTRALIEAIPGSGRLLTPSGPGFAEPASVGCPFSSRCPDVMEVCRHERPAWRRVVDGHRVACHLYTETP